MKNLMFKNFEIQETKSDDKGGLIISGYGAYFGNVDSYGDIILTRTYQDYNGNSKDVRDILPLIRGGFTSPDGVEYSDTQSLDSLSAFNMQLIGYTQNNKLTLENFKTIT